MRKPTSFYFFEGKPIVRKDRYECWRGVANLLGFKAQERLRVEWMAFYYTVGKENAALTARHFAISRKTFHKWSRRFKDSKYNVPSLADQSRAPHHNRHWGVTLTQEERITRLRKAYPYYGKKKLKVLHEKGYCEEISTWKIERVIRRHKLYPNQRKPDKSTRKRARARQKPKRRITDLAKEGRPCFLFQPFGDGIIRCRTIYCESNNRPGSFVRDFPISPHWDSIRKVSRCINLRRVAA